MSYFCMELSALHEMDINHFSSFTRRMRLKKLPMENKSVGYLSLNKWNVTKYLLFDGVAVAFIILAPAMAHMLSFPLWYLEPMRLVLILAMVHTTKQNSYLLALILSFCSWAFSGHPEFIKMLVITLELSANVALFYWIYNRIDKPFAAMLLSILLSKVFCYFLYWMIFSASFFMDETGTFFIMVQLIVSLLFALYTFLLRKTAAFSKTRIHP